MRAAPLAAAVLVALLAMTGGGGATPAPGAAIVFASNRAENLYTEIYSVGIDGRGRRNVSRDLNDDRLLRLAPDGRSIAFVSTRAGFEAVYVARPDGTSLHRLTPRLRARDARVDELSWSPDGRLLLASVHWGTRRGAVYGLYVVDAQRGSTRRLVSENFHTAVWSPDSRRVAYWAGGKPTPLDDTVRVIDTAGRRLWTVPGALPLWSARDRLALSSRPRRGGVRIYEGGGRLLARFPGEARAWSPDGALIAFVRDRALFVADAAGGAPRRLLTGVDPFGSLTWSPDGSKLAAPTPAGRRIVDLSSGRSRLMTGVVSWSPDGSLVAWTTYRRAGDGIYVGRPFSAGRLVAKEPRGSQVGAVVWLRDGKRLLYESSAGDNDHELYAVRPDGTGLRALTRNDADEGDPAWSPDGTRIAYSRAEIAGRECKGCPSLIHVMRADGGGVRRVTRVTPDLDGVFDRAPTWSPDGRRIAFVRGGFTTSGEIHVVNADGTGLRALALRAGAADLDWSPDGRQIAFSGVTGTISTGEVETGRITLLLRRPRGERRGLAWSPDGARIAFGDADGLYVMGADGRSVRRLVQRSDVTGVAWSPDGAQIAFVAGGEIYVADATGGMVTRLTRDPAGDSSPDWAPLRR